MITEEGEKRKELILQQERLEESDVDQWTQKQLRQMETKPNKKRR